MHSRVSLPNCLSHTFFTWTLLCDVRTRDDFALDNNKNVNFNFRLIVRACLSLFG